MCCLVKNHSELSVGKVSLQTPHHPHTQRTLAFFVQEPRRRKLREVTASGANKAHISARCCVSSSGGALSPAVPLQQSRDCQLVNSPPVASAALTVYWQSSCSTAASWPMAHGQRLQAICFHVLSSNLQAAEGSSTQQEK